jgi:hypothetical protein
VPTFVSEQEMSEAMPSSHGCDELSFALCAQDSRLSRLSREPRAHNAEPAAGSSRQATLIESPVTVTCFAARLELAGPWATVPSRLNWLT